LVVFISSFRFANGYLFYLFFVVKNIAVQYRSKATVKKINIIITVQM